MSPVELDLLVIGSGPSGQRAAIQAAKLGKRVAVAERRDRLGGVSIHTGTIPSKTLREAVLDQLAERPLDVLDPTRMEETEQQALRQLMDRTARVIAAETAVVREQFRRNTVGWLPGGARFDDVLDALAAAWSAARVARGEAERLGEELDDRGRPMFVAV